MCNACGIYFKNHGFHRPVDLVKASGLRQLSGLRQASHAASGVGRASDPGAMIMDLHAEDTATSPPARLPARCARVDKCWSAWV